MTRILFVGNPTGRTHLIAERFKAAGYDVERVTDLSDVAGGEAWDMIATDEAFVTDAETLNRQFSAITFTAHDMNKRPRKGKGQRKANRAERWL